MLVIEHLSLVTPKLLRLVYALIRIPLLHPWLRRQAGPRLAVARQRLRPVLGCSTLAGKAAKLATAPSPSGAIRLAFTATAPASTVIAALRAGAAIRGKADHPFQAVAIVAGHTASAADLRRPLRRFPGRRRATVGASRSRRLCTA